MIPPIEITEANPYTILPLEDLGIEEGEPIHLQASVLFTKWPLAVRSPVIWLAEKPDPFRQWHSPCSWVINGKKSKSLLEVGMVGEQRQGVAGKHQNLGPSFPIDFTLSFDKGLSEITIAGRVTETLKRRSQLTAIPRYLVIGFIGPKDKGGWDAPYGARVTLQTANSSPVDTQPPLPEQTTRDAQLAGLLRQASENLEEAASLLEESQ
ncbi:MAG: hypothetical protein K0U98_06110 [Deltaproteobacteria bacterium]|nr:hypothetical protein [Deltaproteobacteria bacterium]